MQYDIEYAYLSDTPSFVRKRNYDDAKELIEKYQDKIFDEYYSLDAAYQQSKKELLDDYNLRQQYFQIKKCTCGGNLRYIERWDFWGCENYRNEGWQHTKLTGKTPIFQLYTPAFSRIWLTDILKEVGIHGTVNTKELYQWLIEENGYEDLYLKYSGKSSTETFGTYAKTKIRSSNQELDALRYLDTIYNKVIWQQCITYRLRGKKETFCIPDFICSLGQEVHVIDAKLDYCNDDKMHLYVQLVSVVLRSKDDHRKVKGLHVLQHEEVESDFGFIKLPKNY